MTRAILSIAAFLLMAGSTEAQHVEHKHHTPYMGEERRAIKSLSEEDIAELRRGGGWGLAKAAELNGLPGPLHLLELRDEIALVPEQIAAILATRLVMRVAQRASMAAPGQRA